jgi:hypothetical protein
VAAAAYVTQYLPEGFTTEADVDADLIGMDDSGPPSRSMPVHAG